MKLFKEDQRYHDITTLVLVGAIMLLLIATVFSHAQPFWKIGIAIVAIGAIVFLVLRLRMKIRIGQKKMSIRIAPIPWSQIKLRKDEVSGVEFVSSDQPDFANSLTVRYGDKLRMFNFGDTKGMVIYRTDGKNIVVLSSQLFENREKVIEQLKSHGWDFGLYKAGLTT